jgi:DNA-binding SARP family transcriptional activator
VLWRLSRSGYQLVTVTPSHLALAHGIDVDVRQAVDAARHMLDHPEDQIGVLTDDLGGDLLPDWYDDWVENERERHRQLRMHALEAVAEDLLDRGRYGHAVDACLLAVRIDPLRESAYRLLVRIYLAESNLNEALRAYRAFAGRLSRELGLEPSVELKQLVGGLADAWSRGDGSVTPW